MIFPTVHLNGTSKSYLQDIFQMTMIGYNRMMYEAKKIDKSP